LVDYPVPVPGLVLRYAYLWKREADQGKTEGRKDRPCVVVLCVEDVDGEKVVTVAPVTRTRPGHPELAIELSEATRRRLGLGKAANWVLATEVNSFYWPGPDLRVTPAGAYSYGELPAVVFEALKKKILAAEAVLQAVERSA
jgi:hypothetical protein